MPRLLFLLEGRVAVSITPSHGRTHLITCYDPVALICGDVEVALETPMPPPIFGPLTERSGALLSPSPSTGSG